MNTLPVSLKNIAFFLQRLPGIGQKTANRLALYLLRLPKQDLQQFADYIGHLKERTKFCNNCMNLTENDLCSICEEINRDQSTIVVVETVLDILSFETGNIYKGLYHVLHGKIDPLNNIGPEDIYIHNLETRIQNAKGKIREIIIATSPDMEGEATSSYIVKNLKKIDPNLKITRLAYGLPIGASVEYTDYGTLGRAIEGRREVNS